MDDRNGPSCPTNSSCWFRRVTCGYVASIGDRMVVRIWTSVIGSYLYWRQIPKRRISTSSICKPHGTGPQISAFGKPSQEPWFCVSLCPLLTVSLGFLIEARKWMNNYLLRSAETVWIKANDHFPIRLLRPHILIRILIGRALVFCCALEPADRRIKRAYLSTCHMTALPDPSTLTQTASIILKEPRITITSLLFNPPAHDAHDVHEHPWPK